MAATQVRGCWNGLRGRTTVRAMHMIDRTHRGGVRARASCNTFALKPVLPPSEAQRAVQVLAATDLPLVEGAAEVRRRPLRAPDAVSRHTQG